MSDSANTVYLEDLIIDQEISRVFQVTDAVIAAFAEVSGDHNPIHVDEAYAAASPFKGKVAHGMLAGAYISATVAGGLPGWGTIYVGQTLSFKRAIRPGDEATVHIRVKDINLKTAHVQLQTTVRVRGKVFVDGVAEVIAPKKPVSV